MSRWWNNQVGTAGQGIDDPWSAISASMLPAGSFPGQRQPAVGAKPTAESLGMAQSDFDKYVTVNKDGSWSVSQSLDGSMQEKGFVGAMTAGFGQMFSDAAKAVGWGTKNVVKPTDKFVSDVPVLGDVYKLHKWVGKNLIYQPLDKLATGAYWLYSEAVSQPLTTAILQLGKASQGNYGALASGSEWNESYSQAQHISPGQAFVNTMGVQGVDPLEAAGRGMMAVATSGTSLIGPGVQNPEYSNERYLYDTNYWEKKNGVKYSIGTGLLDAQASMYLDPTIAAGKVAKPLLAAKRAVKVEEGVQKGIQLGGRNIIKPQTAEQLVAGKKFTALAETAIKNNWSPEQIRLAMERGRGSRKSAFTDKDMGGVLSEALAGAKTVEDWQLAARFAMGDADAFATLAQKNQAFALQYGKALDHKVNIMEADKIYRKSYSSLAENNFQARPIKSATLPNAVEQTERPFGPMNHEWTFSEGAKRDLADRLSVDEQGGLFLRSSYVTGTEERAAEDVADASKNWEQLAFEGKGFKYQVKPLDPATIPTSTYTNVQVPGLVEWRAGVQSNLAANAVQLNAMANENRWLSTLMRDTSSPANNPLFGSLKEARFAGVGRNVVKQSERRQVQYLGARANDGFQSRLLQNGVYGGMVRFIGKMGDRLPEGVLNHNEGDSAQKLGNYLNSSPIEGPMVAELVNNYSRIANKSDSIKYVDDVVMPMIYEGFGRKYGLDLDTVQDLYARYMNISRQELDAAKNPSMQFTSATMEGPNGQPIRLDQLGVDGERVAAHPQFVTQMQYTSIMPNLKKLDRFFVKNADTVNRMRRAGIGVFDALDTVAGSYNHLFKLGNLLRVSYVARNVGEETLARSAKFGAFALLADMGKASANMFRNAGPVGALVDSSGRVIRNVDVNRALPLAQRMNAELDSHINRLRADISRKSLGTDTFMPGHKPEVDQESINFLQDRLDKALAARAEFTSYEQELLQHGAREARRAGEGTFMYKGNVVPEAFNEAYAGAIPRDQITSSESWKTMFSRIEAFGKEDLVRSGNWKTLTPGDLGHLTAWERAINLQILQDPVGLRMVKDPTGEEALKFLRSPEGSLYRKELGMAGGRDPVEHIDIVKQMIDQYIPEALREQAAKNGKVNPADLKAIPENERALVHGEELKMAMKGDAGHYSWVDNLSEKWFQSLPRMASDRLSWQPVYVRAHRMHMQELIDLHMNTLAKMGKDQAFVGTDDMNKMMARADKMARTTMREVLYQPSRTNSANALRYISPFFSAYADSMVRWGGLVAEKPELLGKVAKIYNAPVAANLVTDRFGNKMENGGYGKDGKLVPMSDRVLNFQINPLTRNLPAGLSNMQINVGSLNVVTPGEPWWNPGFGPVVSIPADTVMRNYPKSSEFLNWLNPYGTKAEGTFEDIGLQLTPKYLEDLMDGWDPDGQKYQDALMASYRAQMVDYHQHGGNAPDWKVAEQDASRLFKLNALADAILPGQTREADKYQFYIDAFKNLQQADASTAKDKFLAQYGKDFKEFSDAMMFTVGATKSGTGIPSTVEGLAQSEKYGALIKAHPELGGFIVGDAARSGEFNQWVLLNQKASGDRTTVTAEDRVKQAQINAGWEAYNKINEGIRGDMTKMGLTSLQQKGGERLAALKQRAVLAIATKYEAWADDFTVNDRDAIPKRIAALREIVSDPRIMNDPNRTDAVRMASYLQRRDQFAQILAARKKAGGSNMLTAKSNRDLYQGWQTFRDAISESDTKFSTMMDRYLANDNIQSSVIGG